LRRIACNLPLALSPAAQRALSAATCDALSSFACSKALARASLSVFLPASAVSSVPIERRLTRFFSISASVSFFCADHPAL
jgi:hypothetical protein